MKTKLTLFLGLLTCACGLPALAQGTAFTYQGRLNDGGTAGSGVYDLRMTIYDAASGGNLRGLLTNNSVSVSNGLFTTTLDFGPGVFNGGPRWLEIGVRSNGTASAFTPLSPRQSVLPAPYASWAANASLAVTLSGTVPASGLNGLYSNPVSFNNPANGFAGDGGGLNNVNAAQLGGRTAGQFWQTGGNAGTAPATDFLGTTDNQPLELRVNGQRALRLEPGTNGAPNVIGGSPWNFVASGVNGATVSGGGTTNLRGAGVTNRVTADYGTVGGGGGNLAGGGSSVVAGGWFNRASGFNATVGGGQINVASGENSTVGGGAGNTASGDMATALGYFSTASGFSSTALGSETSATNNDATALGRQTLAGGSASTALGYRARALHNGSFVWADQQDADFDSTITNQFAVRASGGFFLDGRLGIGNPSPDAQVDVSAGQAVVRLVSDDSANGSVLGLRNDSWNADYIGAINFESFFGTPGQIAYLATDAMAFRVGDEERMRLNAGGLTVNGRPVVLAPTFGESIEFIPNSASAWRLEPNSTSGNILGGHAANVVSNGVFGAFIGGGGNASLPNRVGGNYASVLGGVNNTASGEFSTAMGIGVTASGARSVAMGWDSVASGFISTAMGRGTAARGDYATAMGVESQANGLYATAIGFQTIASGTASTALGSMTAATTNDATALGRLTVAAGVASTALGYRARALHQGSFVWADQQEVNFDSTTANQFSLRASGGVRLANDTSLSFGDRTRQMINLWDTGYGIGVQTDAQYFRSYSEFIWYRGGSHSDAFGDAGPGGTQLMRLGGTGNLIIAGTLSQSSDRNVKEDFASVDAQEVLAKVAALPIQSWSYTNQPGVKHVGPVAQDFHAAFGLNGGDDKHIATVDADGVALAAIQGLNQKLESENAALKARIEKLERLVESLANR